MKTIRVKRVFQGLGLRGWSCLWVCAGALACVWPSFAQDAIESPESFWRQATLYRDEWGSPHVYSADWRALAFVFGYAQAEDHLEHMLLAYRVAAGRAAEAFGEPYAASDEFALKMNHAGKAREALDNADPLTRDLCEGFALGVNAWIVDHPDRTPPWADGARPEDPLALLHCYLMSFAPFDLPDVFCRAPAAFSGNAWAIGPERSATGETMLAINPHTLFDGPFLWYEAHLVCGDMNVAGVTLSGLPVILQGHNGVLGWALTPNRPDFGDIYIEPEAGGERGPGTPGFPFIRSDEQIMQMMLLANTRTYFVSTPEGPVERSVPCVETSRGPVVGMRGGRLYSYRVGGYGDFGAIAQLVEMASAQDLDAFRGALSMHQLPCFHLVYADRAGNILYLYNTKVGNKITMYEPPVTSRAVDNPDEILPPRIVDWRAPLPVGDPICSWGEIIPVDQLPTIVNPDSGFVQACGNPPWAATDNAPINPSAIPAWLSQDRDTYRAQRVRRLLTMGKRSFRDCQSMLYDVAAPFAAEAAPRLIEIAEARPDFVANSHPDLASGVEVLRKWNYLAETTSVGMTFFHAWWTALRMEDGSPFHSDDDVYAAFQENASEFQDAAMNAAAEAARTMRNEFQSVSTPWGRIHTLRRGPKEIGVPGATTGEPIFVMSDGPLEEGKCRVAYGCAFSMAVKFGDTPTAVSMVPFGASENPASPHYADQLDLMAERRFKVTRFLEPDVQRSASSARGCLIRLRPLGMEGLFVLQSQHPMEARLNTTLEPPAELPKGLVPFSLFVEPERAPRQTTLEVHIEMFVPPVLCAEENLDALSVYGYDPLQKWVALSNQDLDTETRIFSAFDAATTRVYAVLGPAASRLAEPTIPGNRPEPSTEKGAEVPPEPTETPVNQAPEPATTDEQNGPVETERPRVLEMTPTGRSVLEPAPKPLVPRQPEQPIPPEGIDLQTGQPLPELDFSPLLERKESVSGKNAAGQSDARRSRVKRNFNLHLNTAPRKAEVQEPPKKERKKRKKEDS